MKKSLDERIAEVIKERVDITAYDPAWPRMFEEEREHLKNILPAHIIRRIEHFGSTAVPNLAAKPIIDILVEISSVDEARKNIVPVLENEGYDYFWRPAFGDDGDFYHWFIKRDNDGNRTHHIHMVASDSDLWDRLYFRDYLIEFPAEAKLYGKLKVELSKKFSDDRVKYTEAKSEYIVGITKKAKEYYCGKSGKKNGTP